MTRRTKSLIATLNELYSELSRPPLDIWICGSFLEAESRPWAAGAHDLDLLVIGEAESRGGVAAIQSLAPALLAKLRASTFAADREILFIPRFEVLVSLEAALSAERCLFVHLMPFATFRDLHDFHPPHITERILHTGHRLPRDDESSRLGRETAGYPPQKYPAAFLLQMVLETWTMLASDLSNFEIGRLQCQRRLEYAARWTAEALQQDTAPQPQEDLIDWANSLLGALSCTLAVS